MSNWRAASVAVMATAFSAWVLAAPVSAQVPARDAVLEALVQEALENNPDLRAAQEALLAARQRPTQVSSLPDPVLSVNYTNEGWSPSLGTMPDTNLAIMASQDLPFPGKRHLRAAIAGLEADQVDQQLARARLSLAASVRRSYSGLLLSRALLALTTEQGELWKHTEGVVRARYGVGQGNQQDVLRTQVELTRVRQLVVEQETDIAIRRAGINRLLGRAADAPLAIEAELAAAPPAGPLAVELEIARSASPEIAAARLGVERARLAVDLARKDFKPDFAVQGGYMNRGGLDPMWQAGVSITLPVRRQRRQSALAEAEAQVRSAEARAGSVELQLRFRTQERLAQLEAARQTAELHAGGIVRQDEMSVEAARASYQTGRLPFVAVLEALTTLYADRATLARLLEAQARIRADLDEASLEAGTGAVSPGPLPSSPAGSMATEGSSSASMGSMSR
jgi:cobalt-zinc-cadmium efflux system outer membrane protein